MLIQFCFDHSTLFFCVCLPAVLPTCLADHTSRGMHGTETTRGSSFLSSVRFVRFINPRIHCLGQLCLLNPYVIPNKWISAASNHLHRLWVPFNHQDLDGTRKPESKFTISGTAVWVLLSPCPLKQFLPPTQPERTLALPSTPAYSHGVLIIKTFFFPGVKVLWQHQNKLSNPYPWCKSN